MKCKLTIIWYVYLSVSWCVYYKTLQWAVNKIRISVTDSYMQNGNGWLHLTPRVHHYPNQCRVIVNWTLRNKFQWAFNRKKQKFINSCYRCIIASFGGAFCPSIHAQVFCNRDARNCCVPKIIISGALWSWWMVTCQHKFTEGKHDFALVLLLLNGFLSELTWVRVFINAP